MRWRERVEGLMEQAGVEYRGMVDQRVLAQAMAESDFWLYPTSTPEVGCLAERAWLCHFF